MFDSIAHQSLNLSWIVYIYVPSNMNVSILIRYANDDPRR